MKHLKLVLLLALVSCGTEREIEVAGQPAPAPTPTPTDPTTPVDPSKPTFADIQPLLNTYCLPCHATAGYLKTEAAFKASDAKTRTQSLNMPPPASSQAKNLSQADRAKILAF